MTEENIVDEFEVEYEVKGADGAWKIYYPDEGDIASPFPWYDKEGKLKSVVWAGGSSGKYTETNETFATAKEAIEHAKILGAEKIKLTKSKPRKKKEESL
jgi:hypothetical protein